MGWTRTLGFRWMRSSILWTHGSRSEIRRASRAAWALSPGSGAPSRAGRSPCGIHWTWSRGSTMRRRLSTGRVRSSNRRSRRSGFSWVWAGSTARAAFDNREGPDGWHRFRRYTGVSIAMRFQGLGETRAGFSDERRAGSPGLFRNDENSFNANNNFDKYR